jgi:hypothetical protein
VARIIRGDGVAFPATNRVVSASGIDIYDDLGNIIGFIASVDENLNRQIQRVRHLSSEDAGRVIEMVPMVEDISLTVAGYSLYNISKTDRGSLIHRMGSHMAALKSLQSQREPFHIVKINTHPTSGETVVDKYFDCWFTSFTRGRDIGRLVQIDRAVVQVGQKE